MWFRTLSYKSNTVLNSVSGAGKEQAGRDPAERHLQLYTGSEPKKQPTSENQRGKPVGVRFLNPADRSLPFSSDYSVISQVALCRTIYVLWALRSLQQSDRNAVCESYRYASSQRWTIRNADVIDKEWVFHCFGPKFNGQKFM